MKLLEVTKAKPKDIIRILGKRCFQNSENEILIDRRFANLITTSFNTNYLAFKQGIPEMFKLTLNEVEPFRYELILRDSKDNRVVWKSEIVKSN